MLMKKRSIIIRLFTGIAIALASLVAVFLIYTACYYRADATVSDILKSDDTIQVSGNLTILPAEKGTDAGMIFYPGANVEAKAYLPLLEKIRQECGVTCVLVKMPFNMAIFDYKAADVVMDKLPDIDKWYICGHSMGGAMASRYAAENQDKVHGLILLGAYIYGSYPDDRALTVYGSLNESVAKHIDYTENIVVIQGGNHAQFGNYGEQLGDSKAAISREDQQDAAVKAIKEFLRRN